jgi:hypothetical protein
MLTDRMPLINAGTLLDCVLSAYFVMARIAVHRMNLERAHTLRERAERSSGPHRASKESKALHRTSSDRLFSSCRMAWTNTTSASPRRPVSSAWPVPCATTFTSTPVLALNSGRIWPNSLESCVEVVADQAGKPQRFWGKIRFGIERASQPVRLVASPGASPSTARRSA